MRKLLSLLLCVLLLSGCGGVEMPSAADSGTGGGADSLAVTEVRTDRLSGDCVMTTEYPAYGPDVDTVTVLIGNRSEELLETGGIYSQLYKTQNALALDALKD